MIEIVPFATWHIEQLLGIAREIHAGSVYAQYGPLDEDKLVRQLAASGGLAPDRRFRVAIEGDLVLGAFYGVVFPTFFNDLKIAKDMGQWTRRDGRQRNAFALLVADFEQWAREQGARKASLGYSVEDADNIEVMRRVAEFHGYEVKGYNLFKEL